MKPQLQIPSVLPRALVSGERTRGGTEGISVDLMSKSYAEKLKDPRWQAKRLEILSRDEFTCLTCQSKDKTLHVHHRWYEKGLDPWDYESDVYQTLCEDCHTSIESELQSIRELASANIAVANAVRVFATVLTQGSCMTPLEARSADLFVALMRYIAVSKATDGDDIQCCEASAVEAFELFGRLNANLGLSVASLLPANRGLAHQQV